MIDLQVSNCCRDGLVVQGRTTRYWTCRNCGKPCDAVSADPDQAFRDLVALSEELGLYEDPAELLDQDEAGCE